MNDRKHFRAVMADYILQNKLQQNLILNAFDEDIVERLSNSADAALVALRMVRTLADDHGLAKNAALWSVTSWCYMLGLDEIADCINGIGAGSSRADGPSTDSDPVAIRRDTIGFGTYAAGYDIPAGLLSIRADQKITSGQVRAWIISEDDEDLLGEFKDSISVRLKKGELIKLELVFSNSVNWPDYTFTVIHLA